jgi:hypothetical protein
MSDSDKNDRDRGESTHAGGGPPAIPAVPAPPAGEATHGVAAPPSPPSAPPPPPDEKMGGTHPGIVPPPVIPPPAPPPSEEEEGTVYIPREVVEQRPSVVLNREQPPGHPGGERLERDQYLVGRSQNCDIKLFSKAASREHARLTRHADGWYIEACPDKLVLANGSPVRQPTRLEHRMRLQMGGDELVVIDQAAAIHSPSPPPSALPPRRRWPIAVLVGALVAAALLAAVWLLSRG